MGKGLVRGRARSEAASSACTGKWQGWLDQQAIRGLQSHHQLGESGQPTLCRSTVCCLHLYQEVKMAALCWRLSMIREHPSKQPLASTLAILVTFCPAHTHESSEETVSQMTIYTAACSLPELPEPNSHGSAAGCSSGPESRWFLELQLTCSAGNGMRWPCSSQPKLAAVLG